MESHRGPACAQEERRYDTPRKNGAGVVSLVGRAVIITMLTGSTVMLQYKTPVPELEHMDTWRHTAMVLAITVII
ncbi:MAG: hypothetical protein ACLQBD_12435 [Syntrophobacteraceae bacterium]